MKGYTAILLILISIFSSRCEVTFSGNSLAPIIISPDAKDGLQSIFVINDCNGVKMAYESSSPNATIEWSRFSSLGGAYAEPVYFETYGSLSTITLSPGDMGYIVSENGRQHCYWVVDYSKHLMDFTSAQVNETDSDCAMTTIDIDGHADRITYYTINGIPRELSRDIEVSYNTLVWTDDNFTFIPQETVETLSSFSKSIHVTAPLCNTTFDINGDRFLKEWNRELHVSTSDYSTCAINVHTYTSSTEHESDNEIKDSSSDLGGSAPAEITFMAVCSDAVAYREWQMSRDSEFDIIDLRFNEDEVTYTFHDYGTTYVRFMAANASADCDWMSETYEVNIGESRLECPNAFSPGASEGINDEWRVSYRSIVSFECHIFNRWGVKMFSTTDPGTGWDGKHGGKLVPAGVYFYVIKAKGADGKNYNLSGDINIINYKKSTNSPNYTE